MYREMEGAPKAVTAASGAVIAREETSSTTSTYAKPQRPYRRIIIEAVGPNGPFAVIGQVAKALVALVENGATGVTALEVNSWAFRLGAYVHTLRLSRATSAVGWGCSVTRRWTRLQLSVRAWHCQRGVLSQPRPQE